MQLRSLGLKFIITVPWLIPGHGAWPKLSSLLFHLVQEHDEDLLVNKENSEYS
jgi:hypothetical protein